MLRRLNDLDRDILADLQAQIRRHANLRQTELTAVIGVVRAGDLEGMDDRVRHIWWVELAFLLDADVDIEEGFAVAWEPTGLNGDGPSRDGPLCTVMR